MNNTLEKKRLRFLGVLVTLIIASALYWQTEQQECENTSSGTDTEFVQPNVFFSFVRIR